MRSGVLPLTRSLGSLEILDAAVWFARDLFAGWFVTAAAAPLAFALAFTGYANLCVRFSDPGRSPQPLVIWGGAAILAALFLARGLSQAAATEFLRARIHGERRQPEACWLTALRRPVDCAFLSGGLAVLQWLGLALAIVPGLSVINSRSLALPAAIFEGVPASRALRRSRELTKGSVSGMGLWGALLLAWVALFANALCFGALAPQIVRTLLGLSFPMIEHLISPDNGTFVLMSAGVAWALCDALRTVAFAILYMNARIEQEGSDLRARVEQIRAGQRAEAVHA